MKDAGECPCGSSNSYIACCEPYLSGKTLPATAEALMRSRYTAHVKVAVPYLVQTVAATRRHLHAPQDVQAWAAAMDWKGLTILDTAAGGPEDAQGEVEFCAYYRNHKGLQVMHERSRFHREDGAWRYIDGTHHGKSKLTKIGRNDPCPCGSGKKVKKCCG